MSSCTPYAFELGAWAALGLAGALVGGAYLVRRALPGASPGAQNNTVLEGIPRASLEEEVMEQLTFDDAMAAKEAVLSDVANQHEGWMALAMAKFHEVRHSLPEDFLGEDIRDALLKAGLPQPKSANVWGAFVGYLVRSKLLLPTGQWRAMQAAGSNARRSPVYACAVRESMLT